MTSRTAANRYARALLDVSLKEADPQQVEGQLSGIAGVLTGHADLWKVLTNPAVPTPKKHAVVRELMPKLEADPVVRKFILLLSDRDRLALLPEVVEAYRQRLLEHQKVVRAAVTTTIDLPPDRVQGLQQSLAALTGRRVLLTIATDASLMGGVVTRIGSTIYDGSVRRQLEKMKERLEGAT